MELTGFRFILCKLAIAAPDLEHHDSAVEQILRHTLHEALGIGHVEAMPKCAIAEFHLPVLIGGIKIVCDGNASDVGVNAIMYQDHLILWISTDLLGVFGDYHALFTRTTITAASCSIFDTPPNGAVALLRVGVADPSGNVMMEEADPADSLATLAYVESPGATDSH